MTRKKEPFCGFCGKTQTETGVLVGGINSQHYICEQCVKKSATIVDEQGIKNKRRKQITDVPKPRDIVNYLDQFVIGQDRTKKVLAVSVANHYKRLIGGYKEIGDEIDETVIEKSNVLLLGPTGTGKTLLCRTVANILDVPFAVGDATTITESGFVGADPENLLLKLIIAADFDIELAEMGIIYVDEIDKIRKTSVNLSISKDVGGEGVQQALLKMLESIVCDVPPQGGRKHPQQECIKIDTTNILFICGGAFNGLNEIIARRIGKKMIGFGIDYVDDNDEKKDDLLKLANSEDLIEFGMIPEFVGRFPVVSSLEELDKNALYRILSEPKNSLIKQYQKLFRYNKAELVFNEDAKIELVNKSLEYKTGARALKKVMEDLMLDIQYDIEEECKYVIDSSVVKGQSPVKFLKNVA